VISVGSNEVPCSGGGQYWEGAASDCRDHIRGSDSNDEAISQIIEEAVSAIQSQGDAEFKSDQKWMDIKDWLAETARSAFANTRIMHLTEFGRAVHAEMEGILAAARIGVSVRNATLYTTTFPCHNCAKHIVDAGIREVVYVEPYPKSLGPDLHGDAISVDEKTEAKAKKVDARVRFRPFVGVAPRRYMDLFSMTSKVGRKIARKEKGKPIMDRYFFRLRMPYSDCFEREGLCVEEVNSMIGKEES
jgi:deoxycytidylate deaminase